MIVHSKKRSPTLMSERAHCNELPLLVGKFPNLIRDGLMKSARMAHTLEVGIDLVGASSSRASLDIFEQTLEMGFGLLLEDLMDLLFDSGRVHPQLSPPLLRGFLCLLSPRGKPVYKPSRVCFEGHKDLLQLLIFWLSSSINLSLSSTERTTSINSV